MNIEQAPSILDMRDLSTSGWYPARHYRPDTLNIHTVYPATLYVGDFNYFHQLACQKRKRIHFYNDDLNLDPKKNYAFSGLWIGCPF